MFNGTQLTIDAFCDRLSEAYQRNYGTFEPSYGEIIAWAGRMALERIGQTDALYHDVEHTVMVTLVGQEILRGKHIRDGGVTPVDWLNFMISLLCHDIGYVRGVCRADTHDAVSTGVGRETVPVPDGATDAFLTPYHVNRGILFIRERFGGHGTIDDDAIADQIALTRFPTPDETDHRDTDNYRGLVRAADLIGQLADPNYLRKLPALFYEFQETGVNETLGYKTPADLRRGYPAFYWKCVRPFIKDGLDHLNVTQAGRQWVANLYAHVFATEHDEHLAAER
ncbi:MAG: Npun_R2479 family HD domain-containing metalloprotein [Planctomycetota bacterium]